jgi:mannan endo-1,4-beta-mannosidase
LAAQHGAIPLVQINPVGVDLAAIASGQYDSYLRTYATAVRSYGHPVIVSFGHEVNGSWFSWGYRNTPPATFVAAWRRIVTVFRGQDTRNVTWLWTINIVDPHHGIPNPRPWWPGRSYVNWVGIDGYYYKPTWRFAPLFGPTIKAVRALTRDPILIAETGAAPAAGKPAKIADLFAGARAYGLLGFVWFNADDIHNWSVNTPAAVAAFRRAARAYQRPVP